MHGGLGNSNFHTFWLWRHNCCLLYREVCQEKWILCGKHESLSHSNAVLQSCQENGLLSGNVRPSHIVKLYCSSVSKNGLCKETMRPPYGEAARSVANYMHLGLSGKNGDPLT